MTMTAQDVENHLIRNLQDPDLRLEFYSAARWRMSQRGAAPSPVRLSPASGWALTDSERPGEVIVLAAAPQIIADHLNAHGLPRGRPTVRGDGLQIYLDTADGVMRSMEHFVMQTLIAWPNEGIGDDGRLRDQVLTSATTETRKHLPGAIELLTDIFTTSTSA